MPGLLIYFQILIGLTISIDVLRFGAVPSANSLPPVRLGTALSLHPDTRNFQECRSMRRAWEMLTSYVNEERGGVKVGDTTRPLELLLVNDDGTPEGVREATKHLIEDLGVQMLMGPYSSRLTEAAASIANSSDIVMVASAGLSTRIYSGRPRIFTTMSPGSEWMRGAFEVLGAGGDTMVVVQEEHYPNEICDSAFEFAAAKGITNISKLILSSHGSPVAGSQMLDTESLVMALKRESPRLVVGCMYNDPCGQFLHEIRRQRFSADAIVVTSCVSAPGFIEEMGSAAHFVTGLVPWVPWLPLRSTFRDDWTAIDFAKEFTSILERDSTPFQAAAAWAAAVILLHGVEVSGSTAPNVITSVLRDLDLNTIFGRISFDSNGQALGIQKVIQVVPDADRPRVVAPLQGYTEASFYFPAPAWSERQCFTATPWDSAYGVNYAGNCGLCDGPDEVANFSQTLSMRVCQSCPEGFESVWISRQEARRTCRKACPPGQVLDQVLLTCISCDVGKFESSDRCVRCSRGYFGNRQGQTACLPCAPGSVANTSGSSSCTLCSPGSMGAGIAGVICADCMQGTFAEGFGRDGCDLCSVGYMSAHGMSACSKCPAGYHSVWGALACKGCMPGRYQNLQGRSSCQECPKGGQCLHHNMTWPQNKPNYWMNSAEGVGHFYAIAEFGQIEIPPSLDQSIEHCRFRASSCLAEGRCADGHMGRQCMTCKPGYFVPRAGAACLKCPSLALNIFSTVMMSIAYCLGVFFLAVVVSHASKEPDHVHAITVKLLLNHLLTMSCLSDVLQQSILPLHSHIDNVKMIEFANDIAFLLDIANIARESSILSPTCLMQACASCLGGLDSVPMVEYFTEKFADERSEFSKAQHAAEFGVFFLWISALVGSVGILYMSGWLLLRRHILKKRTFYLRAWDFYDHVHMDGFKSAQRSRLKKDWHQYVHAYRYRFWCMWSPVQHTRRLKQGHFISRRLYFEESRPFLICTLYLMYPPIAAASIRPLKCIRFTDYSSKFFMSVSTAVECTNEDALAWCSYIGVFLLFVAPLSTVFKMSYTILAAAHRNAKQAGNSSSGPGRNAKQSGNCSGGGVTGMWRSCMTRISCWCHTPKAMYRCYVENRHTEQLTARNMLTWGFFMNGYRPSFFWWELVIFWRKFLCIIVANIWLQPNNRLLIFFMLAVFSLVMHVAANPFDARYFGLLGRIEMGQLAVWGVSCAAIEMMSADPAAFPQLIVIMPVVVLTLNLLYTAWLAYTFAQHLCSAVVADFRSASNESPQDGCETELADPKIVELLTNNKVTMRSVYPQVQAHIKTTEVERVQRVKVMSALEKERVQRLHEEQQWWRILRPEAEREKLHWRYNNVTKTSAEDTWKRLAEEYQNMFVRFLLCRVIVAWKVTAETRSSSGKDRVSRLHQWRKLCRQHELEKFRRHYRAFDSARAVAKRIPKEYRKMIDGVFLCRVIISWKATTEEEQLWRKQIFHSIAEVEEGLPKWLESLGVGEELPPKSCRRMYDRYGQDIADEIEENEDMYPVIIEVKHVGQKELKLDELQDVNEQHTSRGGAAAEIWTDRHYKDVLSPVLLSCLCEWFQKSGRDEDILKTLQGDCFTVWKEVYLSDLQRRQFGIFGLYAMDLACLKACGSAAEIWTDRYYKHILSPVLLSCLCEWFQKSGRDEDILKTLQGDCFTVWKEVYLSDLQRRQFGKFGLYARDLACLKDSLKDSLINVTYLACLKDSLKDGGGVSPPRKTKRSLPLGGWRRQFGIIARERVSGGRMAHAIAAKIIEKRNFKSLSISFNSWLRLDGNWVDQLDTSRYVPLHHESTTMVEHVRADEPLHKMQPSFVRQLMEKFNGTQKVRRSSRRNSSRRTIMTEMCAEATGKPSSRCTRCITKVCSMLASRLCPEAFALEAKFKESLKARLKRKEELKRKKLKRAAMAKKHMSRDKAKEHAENTVVAVYPSILEYAGAAFDTILHVLELQEASSQRRVPILVMDPLYGWVSACPPHSSIPHFPKGLEATDLPGGRPAQSGDCTSYKRLSSRMTRFSVMSAIASGVEEIRHRTSRFLRASSSSRSVIGGNLQFTEEARLGASSRRRCCCCCCRQNSIRREINARMKLQLILRETLMQVFADQTSSSTFSVSIMDFIFRVSFLLHYEHKQSQQGFSEVTSEEWLAATKQRDPLLLLGNLQEIGATLHSQEHNAMVIDAHQMEADIGRGSQTRPTSEEDNGERRVSHDDSSKRPFFFRGRLFDGSEHCNLVDYGAPFAYGGVFSLTAEVRFGKLLPCTIFCVKTSTTDTFSIQVRNCNAVGTCEFSITNTSPAGCWEKLDGLAPLRTRRDSKTFKFSCLLLAAMQSEKVKSTHFGDPLGLYDSRVESTEEQARICAGRAALISTICTLTSGVVKKSLTAMNFWPLDETCTALFCVDVHGEMRIYKMIDGEGVLVARSRGQVPASAVRNQILLGWNGNREEQKFTGAIKNVCVWNDCVSWQEACVGFSKARQQHEADAHALGKFGQESQRDDGANSREMELKRNEELLEKALHEKYEQWTADMFEDHICSRLTLNDATFEGLRLDDFQFHLLRMMRSHKSGFKIWLDLFEERWIQEVSGRAKRLEERAFRPVKTKVQTTFMSASLADSAVTSQVSEVAAHQTIKQEKASETMCKDLVRPLKPLVLLNVASKVGAKLDILWHVPDISVYGIVATRIKIRLREIATKDTATFTLDCSTGDLVDSGGEPVPAPASNFSLRQLSAGLAYSVLLSFWNGISWSEDSPESEPVTLTAVPVDVIDPSRKHQKQLIHKQQKVHRTLPPLPPPPDSPSSSQSSVRASSLRTAAVHKLAENEITRRWSRLLCRTLAVQQPATGAQSNYLKSLTQTWTNREQRKIDEITCQLNSNRMRFAALQKSRISAEVELKRMRDKRGEACRSSAATLVRNDRSQSSQSTLVKKEVHQAAELRALHVVKLQGFSRPWLNVRYLECLGSEFEVAARRTYWSKEGHYFLYYCERTKCWSVSEKDRFEQVRLGCNYCFAHARMGFGLEDLASRANWTEWSKDEQAWKLRPEAGVASWNEYQEESSGKWQSNALSPPPVGSEAAVGKPHSFQTWSIAPESVFQKPKMMQL